MPTQEKKKKVDQTYRVSWAKPKEHPYRLSALEISCSISQDKRIPACFPACDGVGGTLLRANSDSQAVVWICKQWNYWYFNILLNSQSITENIFIPWVQVFKSQHLQGNSHRKHHSFIPGGGNITINCVSGGASKNLLIQQCFVYWAHHIWIVLCLFLWVVLCCCKLCFSRKLWCEH